MRLSRYYLVMIWAVLGLTNGSSVMEPNQMNRGSQGSQMNQGSHTNSLTKENARVTSSTSTQIADLNSISSSSSSASVAASDVSDDSSGESSSGSDSETENVPIIIPPKELFEILLQAGELAETILTNPLRYPIPYTKSFAQLAGSYARTGNLKFFALFLGRFDFIQLGEAVPLWLLLRDCRNAEKFFKVILLTQTFAILNNFRSFWHVMLHIDQVEADSFERSQCKNLHQSFYWAFEYFRKPIDTKGTCHAAYASLCIFNLLMDDEERPFPKSLVKAVLNVPGIELNVSHEGSPVALFLMGLPKLPEYYHNLILANPSLDVNCIVPATQRSHGHITCHVPAMPLLLHAFIYMNMRALKILWFNPNLKVAQLIVPFFKLLRLAFLFLFFHFWDSNSKEARNIT